MLRLAELVERANAKGYRVELVRFIENAETPGILGMARGAIIYDKKLIKLRADLSVDDMATVLEHELAHAENPSADIEPGPAWELTETGRRRT